MRKEGVVVGKVLLLLGMMMYRICDQGLRWNAVRLRQNERVRRQVVVETLKCRLQKDRRSGGRVCRGGGGGGR